MRKCWTSLIMEMVIGNMSQWPQMTSMTCSLLLLEYGVQYSDCSRCCCYRYTSTLWIADSPCWVFVACMACADWSVFITIACHPIGGNIGTFTFSSTNIRNDDAVPSDVMIADAVLVNFISSSDFAMAHRMSAWLMPINSCTSRMITYLNFCSQSTLTTRFRDIIDWSKRIHQDNRFESNYNATKSDQRHTIFFHVMATATFGCTTQDLET